MPILRANEYRRSNTSTVMTGDGYVPMPEEWDVIPDNEFEIIDEEELQAKQRELLGVTPSKFVEFAIRMPDKQAQKTVPFTFKGRRYLVLPYDTPAKRTLYKCGRQVEKSTLLGNKCLAYCCIISSFQVLYVSPTHQQTKTFSRDRLKEPIETSEVLKAWTTTKLSDSVMEKQFINRSKISMRYAFHSADRTRGIPADMILIDEIQDILIDNIPVIEECASHSIFKQFIYSGTPKSLDNSIEKYWVNNSTQNEWIVPCLRHGTPKDKSSWHWNVLGIDHVLPDSKGLMCDKCHEVIDPMHDEAQWASMNPGIAKKLKEPYEGYRIPQLMVPWLKWDEILDKLSKYPTSQFYNEVLGLSYDTGTRPLVMQDIIDNCREGQLMTPEILKKIKTMLGGSSLVYAGIDWGCHDEETRILTETGFKYFKDLTDLDKVAQFDKDTREMTFVQPIVRTIKDWKKPLIHFEGKGLDMMLTDTHRMLIQNKNGSESFVESAGEVVNRTGSVNFNGYVNWEGKEEGTFTLPGVAKSSGYVGSEDRIFKMDAWLEFLGYYLSEGGLCLTNDKPYCIKMSQRETVNFDKAQKIKRCLKGCEIAYSEFPNKNTGDLNWTIHGKQYWNWMKDNVGKYGNTKRIPRQFLNLSKRQLKILFDSMMLGDGNIDPREGNNNGYYSSTSKMLCEDFQELCIRLGLRSTLSLHKEAEGNRKARYRVSWSKGRDFQFNNPKENVEKVPYDGKVYCCKVPSGFIVTERNGRIAYQGNTGEGSYTVISLGAYIDNHFTIFYLHRFEGQETEPQEQLALIEKLINYWEVKLIATDYGGGFDRNDHLERKYGRNKVMKYQYSTPGQKIKWEPGLKRFLVNRTEVMSDIFSAIKRRDVIRFPDWSHFREPFGEDCLNIFSEYNDQLRQIQYKKSPDRTDDSFHSILLCFIGSLIHHPRYDILNPTAKTAIGGVMEE